MDDVFASVALMGSPPDKYAHLPATLSRPFVRAFPIVPLDFALLPELTTGIYVGKAGDLCVIMSGSDTPVTFTVPAGTVLDVRVRAVQKTGTTVTNIIGLA